MTDHPAIDHEAFKQFERAGYSRVAEGYDQATAPVTSQVNEAILDAVGTAPGTRLLDVACGPGWLSAAGVQRGPLSRAWTLRGRWWAWPSRAVLRPSSVPGMPNTCPSRPASSRRLSVAWVSSISPTRSRPSR